MRLTENNLFFKIDQMGLSIGVKDLNGKEIDWNGGGCLTISFARYNELRTNLFEEQDLSREYVDKILLDICEWLLQGKPGGKKKCGGFGLYEENLVIDAMKVCCYLKDSRSIMPCRIYFSG